MKKFFSILMVASMVAFSFISCDNKKDEPTNSTEQNDPTNPTDPSDPEVLSFEFEVSDIKATEATVKVTPSNNEEYYYWSVVETAYFTENTADEVAASLIEYEVEEYESTFESLLEEGYIVKGVDTYTYTSLDPQTEYAAIAFAIDENLKITGAAATKKFTTVELVITGTEQLSFDDAVLTDYTAYGMFQVAAGDDNMSMALTFYADDLEGEFTTEDLFAYYSGFADSKGEYSIVTVSAKGELLNEGTSYKLSGEFVASNGIKYEFTFVAPVEDEEEEATAPARMKKIGKATKTVKSLRR